VTDELQDLPPARPQWSDDGTRWWDGRVWVPKEEALRWRDEVARASAVKAPSVHQPPAPVVSPVPVAPRSSGYAMSVWSFVLGLLGISVAAIVLGHVARSRSRQAGLQPFFWSRLGLVFGYLGLVVGTGVVLFLLYVGRGGLDEHTAAGQSLLAAAEVERQYRSLYGGYGMAALAPSHFRAAPGVEVTVVRMETTSYCLRARDQVVVLYYDSRDRAVTRTPCS